MRRVKCPFCDNKKTYSSSHSLRLHIELSHDEKAGIKVEEGSDMLKAKVRKIVEILDGKHIGRIESMVLRKTEKGADIYEYLDMEIAVLDVPDGVIRYGLPFSISVQTQLGKLLMSVGYDITKHLDEEIDVEKILTGKNITFRTYTEETTKGDFSRVVKGSVSSSEK